MIQYEFDYAYTLKQHSIILDPKEVMRIESLLYYNKKNNNYKSELNKLTKQTYDEVILKLKEMYIDSSDKEILLDEICIFSKTQYMFVNLYAKILLEIFDKYNVDVITNFIIKNIHNCTDDIKSLKGLFKLLLEYIHGINKDNDIVKYFVNLNKHLVSTFCCEYVKFCNHNNINYDKRIVAIANDVIEDSTIPFKLKIDLYNIRNNN